MKKNIKIPFFKEFPQLYAAFGIPYKSAFPEINLFNYEDAKSCTMAIPPYRNNFYQIFFLHHSQLSGNYNDTNICFEPERSYLFFTCPGKLISWERSSDLHGYIFSFKSSFLLPFTTMSSFLKKFTFFNPEENHPVLLDSRTVDHIVDCIGKIAKEYNTPQSDSFEIVFYNILILLIHVKRICLNDSLPSFDSKHPGRNKFLLTEFENLVRKNYSTIRTVNEYAHLLHVTPKYLSDALKKESGKTAQQIFQDILMLEAKSFLLQTNVTIGELSHRLGFVDPSYFSKMFKAKNGMTPAAFRKKL
jgi:AraC family transcriptional regulator, transcriptional activator of pobA